MHVPVQPSRDFTLRAKNVES